MNRQAFSLIELVFVIVILGILSAIAIPQISVTREDAIVAKGRSEVSQIKNAILLDFSKRLLSGDNTYPSTLDSGANGSIDAKLFDVVLDPYPIYSSNKPGHWLKTSDNNYTYYISPKATVLFSYNATRGTFDCVHNATNPNCAVLTQ